MLKLKKQFKAASRIIDIISRELAKVRNSDDFKNQPDEVKKNIEGAINDLKNFRIKNSDREYTDIEMQNVIEISKTLALNVFSVSFGK